MSRDYFIIMVYVLVCENYQALVAQQPLRRRGFPPALTDEEVITIELCGEYFGLGQDEEIFDYFRTHYLSFFPRCGNEPALYARRPICGLSKPGCNND